MNPQSESRTRMEQDRAAQLSEDARQRARKRITNICPGLQETLDSAMEYRPDDEQVAKDFGVRRPDAAHLFGRRTRKLVRQIQSDVRQLRDEVRQMRALLGRAA